mmetsp:Transcript_32236/g.68220  ORF Transcript_32236/g.68220 Transcript_32236/m.68220 type:complete len:81 (-) Transcript_32236:76-318(-)
MINMSNSFCFMNVYGVPVVAAAAVPPPLVVLVAVVHLVVTDNVADDSGFAGDSAPEDVLAQMLGIVPMKRSEIAFRPLEV